MTEEELMQYMTETNKVCKALSDNMVKLIQNQNILVQLHNAQGAYTRKLEERILSLEMKIPGKLQ